MYLNCGRPRDEVATGGVMRTWRLGLVLFVVSFSLTMWAQTIHASSDAQHLWGSPTWFVWDDRFAGDYSFAVYDARIMFNDRPEFWITSWHPPLVHNVYFQRESGKM